METGICGIQRYRKRTEWRSVHKLLKRSEQGVTRNIKNYPGWDTNPSQGRQSIHMKAIVHAQYSGLLFSSYKGTSTLGVMGNVFQECRCKIHSSDTVCNGTQGGSNYWLLKS